MVSFEETSLILSQRAEEIARYLFPNGKKIGNNWCIGSIKGEPGDSLKICISGNKIGIWCDFNGGIEKGGDLIQLWANKMNLKPIEALKDIYKYIGINPEEKVYKKQSNWSKPDSKYLIPIGQNSVIRNYLTTERKLSNSIIDLFKISEKGRDIVFNFFEDNSLTLVKFLSIDRIKGKKKISSLSNCKPILFGWNVIPIDATSITICEGEIDAMSLSQYGIPALSVPFGAGKGAKQSWLEHEKERLSKFKTIYLCFDDDDPGKNSISEIVKLIGIEKCKIVKLPYKDPNECLQKNVTQSTIIDSFTYAKEFDIKLHDNVCEFPNQSKKEFVIKNASEIEIEEIEWLWENKVAYGKITLFAGEPGIGKSQLLLYISSIVSSGSSFHLEKKPTKKNKVLLISGEDSAADTIVPRLMAIGANLSNIDILEGIKKLNRVGETYFEDPSLVDDIHELEKFIVENNYKVLIIDPISLYLGNTDQNNNKDVRKVLSMLSQMAERLGIAIILNSHFSKPSGNFQKNAIYRIMGSLGFAAAARTVMAIAKDTEDPSRILFIPIKNNIGNDKVGLVYKIEEHFLNLANKSIRTSRIKWVEEYIYETANEVLNNCTKKSDETLDKSVELLAEILSNGEKSFSEIRTIFVNNKLSMRQLYKAGSVLKVKISDSILGKNAKIWSIY